MTTNSVRPTPDKRSRVIVDWRCVFLVDRVLKHLAVSVSLSTWGPKVNLFCFQAEDGIRDVAVTGVQTCALPISGDTRLVCSGAAIRLVEKLTYREIYKFRSFLQSSVASRRHNDELPIRQAPEYLDRFLYRRETVIASHDENGCRDLFEVCGFDRDGGYPHGVALPQHRHPMSGTVGAGPPVVGPEVWRQRVRYCLKLVG